MRIFSWIASRKAVFSIEVQIFEGGSQVFSEKGSWIYQKQLVPNILKSCMGDSNMPVNWPGGNFKWRIEIHVYRGIREEIEAREEGDKEKVLKIW